MKRFAAKWLVRLLAIFLALLFWLPVFWTFLVSIKPNMSPVYDVRHWFDPPFTLDNFRYVLDNPQAKMFQWIGNSLITTVLGTAGVVLLSLLGAYSFSKFKYPGQKILFWICMAGMMIPGESLLIPQYLLFRDMNLLNTYASLILPGLGTSMGLLILKQFMDGIPESLFEAARIDGCSSFRMLWQLTIPLTKPAIATLAIFMFRQKWNDYLWPYISISNPEIMTVPVGITFFQGQFQEGYGRQMAANAMAIFPALVVFLIFQKNIIKGIALSGIKE